MQSSGYLAPNETLTAVQKAELDKRHKEFLAGKQETFAAVEVHEKLKKKYNLYSRSF